MDSGPRQIKLKKGFTLQMKGEACHDVMYQPIDRVVMPLGGIRWFTPKLTVEEGQPITMGEAVGYVKEIPAIKLTAPISGIITEIVRGEKRKLMGLAIEATAPFVPRTLDHLTPPYTKETIVDTLLSYGYWPAFRQRPYNILANPAHAPKALFISCFDTAPLAPNYEVLLQNRPEEFEEGMQVVAKMEFPKIYVCVPKGDTFFSKMKYPSSVEVVTFEGEHPAGNVGTHVHFLAPTDKNDLVWHISPQDIAAIGHLFLHKEIDFHKIIALTGSSLKKPIYWKTMAGAPIAPLLKDGLLDENVRVISGNVLTGTEIGTNGTIHYHDLQVTAIPEGEHRELLGWTYPGLNKVSLSPTFLSRLFPKRKQVLNTFLNGGHRPLMFNDVYQRVFPLQLLPFPLLRACLAKDWDTMEALGIYEITEADVALCEFVCPSKSNFQEAVHDALYTLYKENH